MYKVTLLLDLNKSKEKAILLLCIFVLCFATHYLCTNICDTKSLGTNH